MRVPRRLQLPLIGAQSPPGPRENPGRLLSAVLARGVEDDDHVWRGGGGGEVLDLLSSSMGAQVGGEAVHVA